MSPVNLNSMYQQAYQAAQAYGIQLYGNSTAAINWGTGGGGGTSSGWSPAYGGWYVGTAGGTTTTTYTDITPQPVLGPVVGHTYESHCWSCKAKISSKTSKRCPTCNGYACQKCGECFCGIKPARLPAPRPFNKFINASDLMEEFIKFLGTEGVRQGEVMDLPMELFIKWLIIKACEEDKEEPNVTLELPKRGSARCVGCGKFIRKQRAGGPLLHTQKCAGYYFKRQTTLEVVA